MQSIRKRFETHLRLGIVKCFVRTYRREEAEMDFIEKYFVIFLRLFSAVIDRQFVCTHLFAGMSATKSRSRLVIAIDIAGQMLERQQVIVETRNRFVDANHIVIYTLPMLYVI